MNKLEARVIFHALSLSLRDPEDVPAELAEKVSLKAECLKGDYFIIVYADSEESCLELQCAWAGIFNQTGYYLARQLIQDQWTMIWGQRPEEEIVDTFSGVTLAQLVDPEVVAAEARYEGSAEERALELQVRTLISSFAERVRVQVRDDCKSLYISRIPDSDDLWMIHQQLREIYGMFDTVQVLNIPCRLAGDSDSWILTFTHR